jgi:hypothetical protein
MTEQNNGIAGIRKIKFDFDFKYAKDGDEDLGDTIVLIAPSFLDLDFNNHMTSTVSKALTALNDGEPTSDEENATASALSDEEKEVELRKRALNLVSIGLSEKKYNEFVKYLIKKLTNNSKYAHIEDTEIGVTDLLWREIEAKGGKKAIQRILSEYTHFFIQDLMKAAA